MTDYTNGGVTYSVTQVGIGLGATDTVVITDPGGTVADLTGLATGNVITPDQNDGGTIGGLLDLAGTYVVAPNATGTIDIVAGLLPGTAVYVGGTATIDASIAALSGLTVYVTGGAATISGGVAGAISGLTVNLSDGGTYTNGSAGVSLLDSTTINFGTGGGTLIANAGGGTVNVSSLTINGFATSTDQIEFQNVSAPITSYDIEGTGATQTITLYNGATSLGSVTVAGTSFATGPVTAGQSGPLTVTESGGVADYNITIDPGTATLPCFLGGTEIATPDGGKDVETLKPGDLVLAVDGHAVPVRWVGRRAVSTLFADPVRVMPVRIRAGALAEGVPARDLLLSPDHALFLGGILVQAGALVNGVSILREMAMPAHFTYYHVEVEGHALIWAEGAAAETFIDNVDRMAFDNWGEHVALYGGKEPLREMDYPRAKSARQVPADLRRVLLARAGALSGEMALSA